MTTWKWTHEAGPQQPHSNLRLASAEAPPTLPAAEVQEFKLGSLTGGQATFLLLRMHYCQAGDHAQALAVAGS